MPVKVRVGAALSRLLDGRREAEAEGRTVGDLVRALGIGERLCDVGGKLRRHFNVHVNEGEDVRLLGGLDTPVKDGDVVTILSAIAGGGETTRKLWLRYPKALIGRPLVWEAGQKFKVVTNIRQASVSQQIGILGLELSGDEEQVGKAIEFLAGEGISVEPIELDIVE